MQAFRKEKDSFKMSPTRTIYGKISNGTGTTYLIAPLDMVLIQINNDGDEIYLPPGIPGALNNAEVISGRKIAGKIQRYDYPPANPFDVIPITFIKPDPTFDLDSIEDVARLSPASAKNGDSVTLTFRGGLEVKGKISDTPPLQNYKPQEFNSYPDAQSQVNAYRVDFQQTLPKDARGGRLTLDKNDELLGMLIATQNLNDGSCRTLVFPAHRVKI